MNYTKAKIFEKEPLPQIQFLLSWEAFQKRINAFFSKTY